MCPFATNNSVLDFKTNHDPPLTTEINGAKEIESIFDMDDCDPILSSIFAPPDCSPAAFNIFDNSETISIFKELEYSKKNDDGVSHYTATTVNTADDRDMLNSDFYYSSPSKLHLSAQDNDKLGIKSYIESTMINDNSVNQMLQNDTTGYSSGLSPVRNDNFLLQLGIEKSASERVSNSIIFAKVKPQKMHYDKYLLSNMPFKVQKPRQAQYPDLIQNIIDSYNMELNYILRSESSEYQNTITSSLSSSGKSSQNNSFTNETKEDNDIVLDGQEEDTLLKKGRDEKPASSSKSFSGRPRKEKRIKCLKRDSTATLQEKLQYFNYIMEDARSNGRSGIFLRDQAASELSIKKHEHHSLKLTLLNFDEVERDLEKKMLTQSRSFRTLWRIVKTQKDHNIMLKLLPSDEMKLVEPEDMEISVFTLIVAGHKSKHLVTSCQYLELVNFILGKDYNHLLNDNLAETTVGSDGKMISTQKHHASRVRSHVKKFLKRHVIKDMKRYTEEERCNIDEFRYQMVLHNLVMNCTVKKPFESKVSVALMELQNLKYALLKQAEFFTFKKITH